MTPAPSSSTSPPDESRQPAAPNPPSIDGGLPHHAGITVCDVCQAEIGWEGFSVLAYHRADCLAAWGFCAACYAVLAETIRVEVLHGPGTPPPAAWTKVRRLRAARARRWGKADP